MEFFVCLLVFVGFYFPNSQPYSNPGLASVSETAGTWPYAVLALLWAYFPLVLLVNQSCSMCWRTAGPLACKAANELFLQKTVGIHRACWLQSAASPFWTAIKDGGSVREPCLLPLCDNLHTARTTQWVCVRGDSTCLENQGKMICVEKNAKPHLSDWCTCAFSCSASASTAVFLFHSDPCWKGSPINF